MFHDRAKDHRLELLPFAGAFGHGNGIGAEEYPTHPGNAEQPFGEWRLFGLLGIAQIKRAVFQDRPAGQEFHRRGVRRGFGLNEHRTLHHGGLIWSEAAPCFASNYAIRWRICLKVQGRKKGERSLCGTAARYEDRTNPTTSFTASMVWRASFCARPAPSDKTASIAAGS